ncbi:hypothetical protein OFO16_10230 [Vibrio natriegens]|uniref:hypothetical protein n=1 Tax=Vibrio natriegens TaxID=691 RepID=UPI0021E80E3D|nr:hypothetical protein [Vibrio natriegens]UYI46226.1 hypothetical protein OFO16_10230 [Vibrio natriegens]
MFTLTAIAAVTLTGCGGGDDKPKAEKKTLEQQVQSQEVTSAPQTIEIEVPIKQGTKINVPTVAGFTAHAKQGRTVEASKTVAGKTVNHQAVGTTVWNETVPTVAGKTETVLTGKSQTLPTVAGTIVVASTSSITPKTVAGKTITAWEGTTTIAPTVVAGKTVTVSGNKALLATAPAIVPSPMAQATPQIAPSEQGTPVAKAQGIPSEQQVIPTKAKQGKPQVTETRQAIDASQQAIIEVAEYAAARNVDLLPQQVHQLRNVVKSDNSPEAVAAAVAHAKDVVNVQAAQVATEAFMASQGIPTPYAVPTAQDNAVPLFVKAKQGKPAIPAANTQLTPNAIPAAKAQGTPSENITKSKQGHPQVTEARQAIDASQQAIIEVAEYAAARDVALLPQQTRQLRDVVKSDNSPEAVAAAVAHAKDVVNVQAAQVATEAFMASQGIPTPYAVPTAQDNAVPAFVKAKQGKPAIPAANTQLTPNAIPAAKAQGTPEIPDVIAQGTPSENITKSKQGRPQVTEARQAIDASEQSIIEVAEYAAARDVALLPQQTRQLRDVVKSDNSPEAVAAAVARAKEVVNVQAAQVAKEAFKATQKTPTPYAVPTAQVIRCRHIPLKPTSQVLKLWSTAKVL